MLVGLVKGTRVAGGADAYGYVSQALLWLNGLPVQAEPLAAAVPWPHAEWSLAPLGFRPGLQPGILVPTYPPGLPLAMAAAAGIGGTSAVYWVVPVSGAAAVWLTYLLGRRFTDACWRGGRRRARCREPGVPLPTGPADERRAGDGMLAAVALGSRRRRAPRGRSRRGGGRADSAESRAARAAGDRGSSRPRVSSTRESPCRAPCRHHVRAAPCRCSRVPGLAERDGSTVRRSRRATEPRRSSSPSPTCPSTPAVTSAGSSTRRRPSCCSDSRRPSPRGSGSRPRPVHRPCAGVVRPRVRRSGPGVLPAVLAFRGVVVPAVSPPGHSGAAHPRDGRPRPVCAGSAGRHARAVDRACVGVLAWHYVAIAGERSAFALDRLESRYLAAGAFASRTLPERAVLLSVQESGTLRMYGGRTTVRFDRLDPQGLDAAVQFLEREGHRPYFVLEAWEEAPFRERFAASSPLGLLDWPPLAEVGTPVRVRFYDPRDRQRFLAGERGDHHPRAAGRRRPALQSPGSLLSLPRRVAPRIRRTPAG